MMDLKSSQPDKAQRDTLVTVLSPLEQCLWPLPQVKKVNSVWTAPKLSFPAELNFNQKEITKESRSILVDWLVDLQVNLSLQDFTLHNAVRIIDICLDRQSFSKSNFQLLGATCLSLAAKYFQSKDLTPILTELSDGSFKQAELRRMEGRVLQLVEFRLSADLAINHLSQFCMYYIFDVEVIALAHYILDLTLYEWGYSFFEPSFLGPVVAEVAQRLGEMAHISHSYMSGVRKQDYAPVFDKILKIVFQHQKVKKLSGVSRKYSRGFNMCISRLVIVASKDI